MKRFTLLASVMAMVTAFIGCGPDISHLPKTVKAEGVVTLDGNPVDAADLTFISETTNYHATGHSDAQGKFTLTAFQEKPGAVPGNYRVEVNKTIVGSGTGAQEEATVALSYGLPKKYSTMATSGLSVTVPDADTSDIKIELLSK